MRSRNKILYVVGSLGAASTTFLTDLIDGLSRQDLNLTILVQSFTGDYSAPKAVTLRQERFLNRTFFDKCLVKLTSYSQRVSVWDKFKLSRSSLRRFKAVLREEVIDAVFIEFGHNSVMLNSILDELKIPFFVHFHGLDITKFLQNPYYVEGLQQVFKRASGLIVASEHVMRLLVLAGAPKDKIRVVRLEPIDNYEICKKICDARYSGPPSVVFLGRLTEKKHPLALLEAFRIVLEELPEAQLTIIGDGPMRSVLEERIQCYGLAKQVRLAGVLEREVALPLVADHWVYAQHSVTSSDGDQEGFGVSIAEAALMKLPVVSTWHNGIPEQVIDGRTGLLSREYNYEEMAEHLIELLKNPNKCQQLGESGREFVLNLCLSRERAAEIFSIMSSGLDAKTITS
jgi:glycosyltransferase involved in cell wall biosynthesis